MKLFTFGYSGRRLSDFQVVVADFGAIVVDVRFSPRSRQPEWSGASLLRSFGAGYLHFREFGNVNYKNGRPIEIAELSKGLEKLKLLNPSCAIMLLCACKNFALCHRSVVASAIVQSVETEIVQLQPWSAAARLGVSAVTAAQPSQLSIWDSAQSLSHAQGE